VRSSCGRREGAVVFSAVVARRVRLDRPSVLRDLHQVADQAHLDLLEAVAVADPVARAAEAYIPGAADLARDGHACRLGPRGARPGRASREGGLGPCRVAPGVAGDEHAARERPKRGGLRRAWPTATPVARITCERAASRPVQACGTGVRPDAQLLDAALSAAATAARSHVVSRDAAFARSRRKRTA
jgi:hypothetical protein